MEAKNFKTRTYFINRENPHTDNYWGVALDVGYSAVKAFSPNAIVSFPAFAKRVTTDEGIGAASETDIFYRDETGLYAVGDQAYAQMNPKDSSNETNSMFIRDRFANRSFLIISRVGIALCSRTNKYGSPEGKTLNVQTGLPPAYLKSDGYILTETLAGFHKFSVKQGNNAWEDFEFELPAEEISVMPQPMGTLISIATDNEGKPTAQAKSLFKSNLLIFDPGFGTLDTFNIKNNLIDSYNTYNNLGMHRIFDELISDIQTTYGTQIMVQELQKDLTTGTFRSFDRRTHACVAKSFEPELEKAVKKVCDEALRTIDETYDYLQYHDYLVLTGGTSAAWEPYIREYYQNMETLTIINGTLTDNLSPIFTNVRGYYMKQYNMLTKRK